MPSYNKVSLMGNITREPKLTFLPSHVPVCEFGLAINQAWKGKDGEKRESVCFIDCRLFGKQAQTFEQYMTKGKPVLIEGRLELDTWEGREGQKRSKHRIFVERFTFIASRDTEGAPRPASQSRPGDAGSEPPIEEPEDTIPF